MNSIASSSSADFNVFAAVGTALTAIVLVLAVIGALKGLSRGISRQVVRTVTIIASIIISFFVATSLYSIISGFFEGKTMADIGKYLIETGVLTSDTDISWLENMSVDTAELIVMLPVSILIVPIIFVIVFVPVSAIMLIVHGILSAIFGFKKRRNNLLTRLLGAALGFIQGAAVAAILLTPVIGIFGAVDDSVAMIKKEASPEDTDTAAIVESYDEYLKDVAEHPTIKVFGALGIKSLYANLSTFEIDGKDTDMSELFPDLTKIFCSVTALDGVDMMNLTPEDEADINRLLESIESNDYLTSVLAGAIQLASYSYTESEISDEFEEPFASLVNSAMEIFHTTDSSNVHSDIDTIKEVLFILSRDGVLNSFEDGSDAILSTLTKRDANGKTPINRIIAEIDKNERTRPLITMITKLSVSVMSNQMGMDESTVEIYDDIKSGINENVLSINKDDYANEEEYVEAVAESLDETLKKNNIELEPEIVDTMAQYVADNYSDKTEITDDDINDVILSYYDAYLDYIETGVVPDEIPELN